MPEITETELRDLSQRLLDSIDQQDWKVYTELCAEDLTAFEPEAVGHLVEGMNFHKFYFDKPSSNARKQSTISDFQSRLVENVAVITYTRLTQTETAEGEFLSGCSQETRIWHMSSNGWKHLHFHRS